VTSDDHLNIVGTRGVPAAHGGFETFAERLALFLVARGISVTVYCQSDKIGCAQGREDYWNGIHRVHLGTRWNGPLGTVAFDLACIRHVLDRPGVDLVLGYNTAVFCLLQRLRGRRIFMNMDGIEWQRAKWSAPARAWLMFNEAVGANICDVPIADHPEIGRHISTRTPHRPVVIPYGADVVTAIGNQPVRQMGLEPGRYFVSIARIEPDNSILEIVRAFEAAESALDLVVLGRLDPKNAYHREVQQAAGTRVRFMGGIYDGDRVKALRYHARAYLHGHRVGGTNPSLVEALGAGSAVIAHDNPFNRWTAGEGQSFFSGIEECATHIRRLARDDLALFRARMAARERHARDFRWHGVLSRYEMLMFGARQAQIAAE